MNVIMETDINWEGKWDYWCDILYCPNYNITIDWDVGDKYVFKC